jgi:hypothetical protein
MVIYNSEYNFLSQGIKMEQFFARSFHFFGVNSKTSKSKADENQILNEVWKRLMRLLKIKCTNMIINGVTYMNLIYSGLLFSTCKKIIYT